MIDRLKKEPAVVIGALAAAFLAAVNVLVGNDLIGSGLGDFLTKALDPTSGWALPLIVGVITRFFVSPAEKPGL